MSKPVLLPHHLEDLRRSGLSDETVKLSGAVSWSDPDALARTLRWEHPAKTLGPCLVFPFPDLGGNPTGYARVRPDTPRVIDGSPAKYESPRGEPNRPYFPPLSRAAVDDPRRALVFVEGEKKALCIDQAGHVSVGLVGVWGAFESRESDDEPRRLVPDLDAFAWAGRVVRVCFDSDAVYKLGIRHAEWELAVALTALGADVRLVRIPARVGGPKVGADDFIVSRGPAAFDDLLAGAGCVPRVDYGFSNAADVLTGINDKGETVTRSVPRSIVDMTAELVGRAGGYPKRVGRNLVVADGGGRVRPVESHHELFAYVSGEFDRGGASRVHWQSGPGHVKREVFFAHLKTEAERFERADPLPHEPPIPGVLYTGPAAEPDGTFEALEKFLGYFNPASDLDRSLMLAALLTLLWGGPAGKRPGFLFQADDDDTEAGRGVGKSTAAQKFARVFGGSIDLDQGEQFAATKTRLLTPHIAPCRVLMLDNVKSFRLSWGELEALITAKTINGRQNYMGQAEVPNYYTVFLTLNGATLSKDLAQRFVPINLCRPRYGPTWDAEVDGFIEANRHAIIGDLVGMLRRPAATLGRLNRWGEWGANVLARVENPTACLQAISDRTAGMDADRDDADRIREGFAAVLRSITGASADASRVLLRSAAVCQLVNVAINARHTASQASAQLKSLGMPEFRKSDRQGQRMWLWQGQDAPPLQGVLKPSVIDFDPERDQWSVAGQSADCGIPD